MRRLGSSAGCVGEGGMTFDFECEDLLRSRPCCARADYRTGKACIMKGSRSVRHSDGTPRLALGTFAAAVQLVELLFCKQVVAGSTPVCGSNVRRGECERSPVNLAPTTCEGATRPSAAITQPV